MKIRSFDTVAKAKQFRSWAKSKGYNVSPIIAKGCLARGFRYAVQFAPAL